MNPQHSAPPVGLLSCDNNLTRRLAGRTEHQAKFISIGVRGTHVRRGFHAESLVRFVERCLLCLFFAMDGQHLDHPSCMLAWSACHEAGQEGA